MGASVLGSRCWSLSLSFFGKIQGVASHDAASRRKRTHAAPSQR
jgi:hypothetical protein